MCYFTVKGTVSGRHQQLHFTSIKSATLKHFCTFYLIWSMKSSLWAQHRFFICIITQINHPHCQLCFLDSVIQAGAICSLFNSSNKSWLLLQWDMVRLEEKKLSFPAISIVLKKFIVVCFVAAEWIICTHTGPHLKRVVPISHFDIK